MAPVGLGTASSLACCLAAYPTAAPCLPLPGLPACLPTFLPTSTGPAYLPACLPACLLCREWALQRQQEHDAQRNYVRLGQVPQHDFCGPADQHRLQLQQCEWVRGGGSRLQLQQCEWVRGEAVGFSYSNVSGFGGEAVGLAHRFCVPGHRTALDITRHRAAPHTAWLVQGRTL